MKPQNQIQSRTFTWVFVLLLIASGNLSAQDGNLTTIEFDGKTIQVFPTDHPQRLPWGPANNTSGANSTHDGRLNTQTIVDKYAGWNNGNYAARICAQLNAYGYDDWYLPSATEMAHIFGNRNKIQGLYQSSIYWTSTEEHWGADAAAIDLASGIILNRFKDESNRVRCVRGTHKLDEENNDRLDTHKNEPGVRGRVTGTEGMEGLRTHALVVVTNKEITKIYGESTIDASNNYYIPNLPGGRTLYIHFLYSHKVWITEEIVVSDWVDINLNVRVDVYSGANLSNQLGQSIIGLVGVAGHYAEIYLQGQNLQADVALFQKIHYLRLLGQWELHDKVTETSLGELNLSGGGIITFNMDGTGTFPMGDIFYWKSQYKKTGIIRKLGIKTGSDYHLVITKSAHEDFYISGEIFATIYHDGDNYHMLWDESESFTKVNESGVKPREKTTFNGTQVVDVINPATGKTWMDRNLGASRVATSSTDALAYGDFYQWGRATDGHQKRNSGTTRTLSNSDTPGHGNFILSNRDANWDWRIPQNDNLWQGANGINNPCPVGYRLPTKAEFNNERLSWRFNNTTGAFNSPLKLSMAGRRFSSNGSIQSAGSYGFYWSSTVHGIYSRVLHFNVFTAGTRSDSRSIGRSVRCIKD